KAGMKLFGNRGAADNGASLDHANAQSRSRQIGRANEAVVAGANDDGIENECVHAVSESTDRLPWTIVRVRHPIDRNFARNPKTAPQAWLGCGPAERSRSKCAVHEKSGKEAGSR